MWVFLFGWGVFLFVLNEYSSCLFHNGGINHSSLTVERKKNHSELALLAKRSQKTDPEITAEKTGSAPVKEQYLRWAFAASCVQTVTVRDSSVATTICHLLN